MLRNRECKKKDIPTLFQRGTYIEEPSLQLAGKVRVSAQDSQYPAKSHINTTMVKAIPASLKGQNLQVHRYQDIFLKKE